MILYILLTFLICFIHHHNLVYVYHHHNQIKPILKSQITNQPNNDWTSFIEYIIKREKKNNYLVLTMCQEEFTIERIELLILFSKYIFKYIFIYQKCEKSVIPEILKNMTNIIIKQSTYNAGNEEFGYFSFIIEHYTHVKENNIKIDNVIFSQFDSLLPYIACVQLNVNFAHIDGAPIRKRVLSSAPLKDGWEFISKLLVSIGKPKLPDIHSRINMYCCSQFAIKFSHILSFPLNFYISIHKQQIRRHLKIFNRDRSIGIALEHSWRLIFDSSYKGNIPYNIEYICNFIYNCFDHPYCGASALKRTRGDGKKTLPKSVVYNYINFKLIDHSPNNDLFLLYYLHQNYSAISNRLFYP